jgi:DNA-binding NarL/FixJ family response regulator
MDGFDAANAPGIAGVQPAVVVQRALAAAEGPGSPEERLRMICAELRAAQPGYGRTPPPPLGERQLRTLHLLAQGLSNRGIARRLDLAEETVKCHVRSLLDRLNVPNRTALALWAIREGVVPLYSPEPPPSQPS